MDIVILDVFFQKYEYQNSFINKSGIIRAFLIFDENK